LPTPQFAIKDIQEQAVRDLEIKPELFTPPDQMRKFVREFPAGLKCDLGPPPEKKKTLT